MPKSQPHYPDQATPKAENARTFAQIVDSMNLTVRQIEEMLGITYRTYLKRRLKPTEISLGEIMRLAAWLGEDSTALAAELGAHTPLDASVLRPPRRRHPKGITRTGKGKDSDGAADSE